MSAFATPLESGLASAAGFITNQAQQAADLLSSAAKFSPSADSPLQIVWPALAPAICMRAARSRTAVSSRRACALLQLDDKCRPSCGGIPSSSSQQNHAGEARSSHSVRGQHHCRVAAGRRTPPPRPDGRTIRPHPRRRSRSLSLLLVKTLTHTAPRRNGRTHYMQPQSRASTQEHRPAGCPGGGRREQPSQY